MDLDEALLLAAKCQRRYQRDRSAAHMAAVEDAISRIYVATFSEAARNLKCGGAH